MNRFQEAIDIQNACNPVAVAGVLHEQMMTVLREKQSSTAIMEDNAVKLILYKLMAMCHEFPSDDNFPRAYQSCREEADAVLQASPVG